MNPILDLAASFAANSPDEEQLYDELERLSAAGMLTERNLKEALATVLGAQPQAEISMIVSTVNIITMVLHNAGEREKLAFVLFVAADHLDERINDPQEMISALTAAAHFYSGSRHFLSQSDIRFGRSFVTEANICQRLAGLGMDPIINCRKALALYAQAASSLDKDSEDAAVCMLNEASTWQRLAALGEDPNVNYHKAISRYQRAALLLKPGSSALAACLSNEGAAWHQLAGLGGNASEDYYQAIDLFSRANQIHAPFSQESLGCLSNMGVAWRSLANLGVDTILNLGKAIAIFSRALDCAQPGSPDSGTLLLNNAHALEDLANNGIDPMTNYLKAVEFYTRAGYCFPDDSISAGMCQKSLADCWLRLAELGMKAKENCLKALALYKSAAPKFHEGSPDAGSCLMSQAVAIHLLASYAVDGEGFYREAISLFSKAAACFSVGSNKLGQCLLNQATSWQCLGDLAVDSETCYRKAISLYSTAASCFPVGSASEGSCFNNEANTWKEIAEVGVERTANLEKALSLQRLALSNFGQNDFQRAKTICNCAGVLTALCAESSSGVAKKSYLQEALHMLSSEAIPAIERIGVTFCNDAERRSFRETYKMGYHHMVFVCLGLAALETKTEQAEALRWEAWHWVQRSKARTMQESMAAFAEASQEHDPAQPEAFRQMMKEQAERDRRSSSGESGSRLAETAEASADVQARLYDFLAQLLHPAAPASSKAESAAKEQLAAALAHLARQDRPCIVVEFFRADGGRFGAFIHPAGSTTGLAEPVWLAGQQKEAAQLAQRCQAATAILCRSPRYRARDGQARATSAEPQPTNEEITAAMKEMDAIASELGTLLAPVRQFITDHAWTDATLLLCPTGSLHLLPLAAAEWGTDDKGHPQPLIQAHALLHLPTAALATEVIQRQRPATAQRHAYIAAADPWNKLQGIYSEADNAATSLRSKGFQVTHLHHAAAQADTLWEQGPGADVVHLAMHSGMNASRFELCGAEFHDRRFAVLELMRWLRFHRAQLAIIATCSSGQAHGLEADDPSAITRAWMLAGAASVIGGLWPLSDEPAYQFSFAFYQHWTAGLPLADAFREAVLHVREEFPNDICSWAPFILVGNGATVL